MKLKLVIAIVLAALLVGAGAVLTYGFLFSPAVDDAIKLIPADSKLYVNFFLDPSNSQKQALENIIESSPLKSPDGAKKELFDLLNQPLKEQGCSVEEDFEPWVGKQMSFFISDFGEEPDGALLVATENEDAALAAFNKCSEEEIDYKEKSYEGIDYRVTPEGEALGIIDGYLVAGTEDGVKSVVDTSAGKASLDDSDRYRDAVAEHHDHIALMYFDFRGLLDQLRDSGELDVPDLAALQFVYDFVGTRPLTLSFFAERDALVLETFMGLPTGSSGLASAYAASIAPQILSQLPQGAWGAIASGSVGKFTDAVLDLVDERGIPGASRAELEAQFEKETGLSLGADLLSWIGDVGLFVQGTTPTTVSGGAVIESTDRAAAQRAVMVLGKYAAREGASVKPLSIQGVKGFSIQDRTMPQPVNVAVGADRVVIAYGNLATHQALEGEATLSESEVFQDAQDALGSDYSMSWFIEADTVQQFVEDTVLPGITTFDPATGTLVPDTQAREDYEADVKPIIEPLKFVSVGSAIDGETLKSKLVVGIE
ncbi:MAG: DUF3352 domain-containing protein [Actinomycetota bacterium]|nr:DUF3352 domain-containing protein [Actinomycetota bacterium]